MIAERLDDLTPLLERLAEHTGCVQVLADCDEVRRPIPERIPLRPASGAPAMPSAPEAEGADATDTAVQVRAVMPKGRNFH